MSILLTVTIRGRGNLLMKILCNKPTLRSYQTFLRTPPFTSFFHTHLNNSVIKSKDDVSYNSSYCVAFSLARQYTSMNTGKKLCCSNVDDKSDAKENHGVEFPGGKIAFTSELNFLAGSFEKRVKCYRVLDNDGYIVSSEISMSKKLVLKVYSGMVTLQTMDKLFCEAQRQGRLSLYVPTSGEEAINMAAAAALSFDDIILSQYREPGALLWRGFTLLEFANHLFGNKYGHGKGRQMPMHYGSNNLNFITVSATIATQLPHAVGVAYSLKRDKKDACVVAYIGDGGTSEGDFHAALNFAAVLDAPVVFICRNNGWALSTPVTDQFRSDGVVVKGQAYGIQSIRIDGNDAFAIYNAVCSAREISINEQRPILIEAMTYRIGHHSYASLEDNAEHQPVNELEHWKTVRCPITRLRKWIQRKGWWSDKQESELRIEMEKQVKHALDEAEKAEKPPLEDMFTDVYHDRPSNLIEQEKLLRETIRGHPQDFPPDIPL